MVDFSKLRVLYAEDEEAVRKNIEAILVKLFKETIVAVDGLNGLELFKKSYESDLKIDIIITDINMPNKTGLEMIEEIRLLDKDVPIVLMTAHSEAEYLLKAINLNVSQYVIKPINVSLVFDKLKAAYLPIYQKQQLELKNKELKELNIKIKEVAKQEMEELKTTYNYLLSDDSDDVDFGDLLDNIVLDK